MRTKTTFTKKEYTEIRQMLLKKVASSREEQKAIRARLRRHYQFYIGEFTSTIGFTAKDFEEIIKDGLVKII